MKLFLAGTSSFPEIVQKYQVPYLLESFYYIKDWQLDYIKHCKMFLLDSGAFTFINSNGVVDFGDYLNKYIEFINANNIDYFFELDVDSIVGYDKVLEYRELLERGTGKKCIPVYHLNRGKNEFIRLCENYDYIGLGGIAIKEFRVGDWKYFKWFIKEAHKRNCKIHGLGFTSVNNLKNYGFDTVDSTSWTSGGRFGTLYRFENNAIKTYSKKEGKRGNTGQLNEHNLIEWIKFQKYVEEAL